jgi:hypothetical protein
MPSTHGRWHSNSQKAYSLLQAYADKITDATLRQSFLENVATHRAILMVAHTTYNLLRT